MLLLIFAYFHGINGLRNILEDYIHNRSVMKNITIFLAIFAVITVIWAGFAIASFNPVTIK
jgi:succinate dehydrogenase hydrophobic anchor subunit